MMRKLMKQCFGFLAVMLLICGISWTVCAEAVSSMPPLEAASGKLSVTLAGKKNDETIPVPGENIQIFKVADLVVENGCPVVKASDAYEPILDAYEISFDGMTVEQSKDAANILAASVQSPLKSGTTDENGKVSFTGLAPGIYLVVQGSDTSELFAAMSPYLAMVPQAAGDEWNYTVNSKPKTELIPKPDEEGELGKILVTKWVMTRYTGVLNALTTPGISFRVGLFWDADGKIPYDPDGYEYIRTINIPAGSSHNMIPVVYDDLPMGTYYVYELDAMDQPIKAGGTVMSMPVCIAEYADGQGPAATLVETRTEADVRINNVFPVDFPDGYNLVAELQIEKVLKKGSSVYNDSSKTFYVGIYTEDGTLYKWAELKQNDVVTVEVDLGGPEGKDPVTYRIYEVEVTENEDGTRTITPVRENTFPFTVTTEVLGKQGNEVTVVYDNAYQNVRITNTLKEATATPTSTPTSTPTVTPTKTPSYGGGGGGGGGTTTYSGGGTQGTAARTGDDTNLTGAVALLGGAVLVILILVIAILKLKRNGKEQ